MAHPPSGPPGGRKPPSQAPLVADDYGEYEGDATSITGIPQPGPPQAQPPPPPLQPQPPQQPMFPQGSPHLSHMGQPPQQQPAYGQPPPQHMQPGPPMAPVPGTIAQPSNRSPCPSSADGPTAEDSADRRYRALKNGSRIVGIDP